MTYTATDIARNAAKCHFQVIITGRYIKVTERYFVKDKKTRDKKTKKNYLENTWRKGNQILVNRVTSFYLSLPL